MKKHFDAKFIFLGAGLAFAILFFMLFRFSGGNEEEVHVQDTTTEQAQEAGAEEAVRRLSDGAYVSEEEQVKNFYAVMVENSADAWPLSGISEARMVIEAPVEGFIPRFLVLFDDTQEVEQIGPVRSARPYYVQWAYGLQALYAHVGGSPEGLSLINRLDLKDLNEFWFGQFFWRDRARYAPHNVYTSVEELGEGYTYRSYEEETLSSVFSYKPDTPSGVEEQAFSVELLSGASQYRAGWDYDAETNRYQRYQGGKIQYDRDGSEVFAKNVIILFTDISVIDEVGRLKIRTQGVGDGMAYLDGQSFEIAWEKSADDEWVQLVDKISGEELSLNAGMTWIEILPEGRGVFSGL